MVYYFQAEISTVEKITSSDQLLKKIIENKTTGQFICC